MGFVLADISRFVQAFKDAWDESRLKSLEAKKKSLMEAKSLEKHRDRLTEEKVNLVKSQAALSETNACAISTKMGKECK